MTDYRSRAQTTDAKQGNVKIQDRLVQSPAQKNPLFLLNGNTLSNWLRRVYINKFIYKRVFVAPVMNVGVTECKVKEYYIDSI